MRLGVKSDLAFLDEEPRAKRKPINAGLRRAAVNVIPPQSETVAHNGMHLVTSRVPSCHLALSVKSRIHFAVDNLLDGFLHKFFGRVLVG